MESGGVPPVATVQKQNQYQSSHIFVKGVCLDGTEEFSLVIFMGGRADVSGWTHIYPEYKRIKDSDSLASPTKPLKYVGVKPLLHIYYKFIPLKQDIS